MNLSYALKFCRFLHFKDCFCSNFPKAEEDCQKFWKLNQLVAKMQIPEIALHNSHSCFD